MVVGAAAVDAAAVDAAVIRLRRPVAASARVVRLVPPLAAAPRVVVSAALVVDSAPVEQDARAARLALPPIPMRPLHRRRLVVVAQPSQGRIA